MEKAVLVGLVSRGNGCAYYNQPGIYTRYSEMQSDGICFNGDVVSDSFNKTSRVEDNISYQMYKSKYVCNNILMILILYDII